MDKPGEVHVALAKDDAGSVEPAWREGRGMKGYCLLAVWGNGAGILEVGKGEEQPKIVSPR